MMNTVNMDKPLQYWMGHGQPMTHNGIVALVYEHSFEPTADRLAQEARTFEAAKQVGLEAVSGMTLENTGDALATWAIANNAMVDYMHQHPPRELAIQARTDSLRNANYELDQQLGGLREEYAAKADSLNAVIADQRGELEHQTQTQKYTVAVGAGLLGALAYVAIAGRLRARRLRRTP